MKGKAKNIILFTGSFIMILLLFIALIRNAQGWQHLTFSGFLEYLTTSPTIIPSFSITDFAIVSDWGLFNGLKDFLNIFTQLFGIIVWVCSSIINVLLYLFYFLRFIFRF